MKGILLAAAAASVAFVASVPETAAAQTAAVRHATAVDHHSRSVTHYTRTPRSYAARSGDSITSFSSSENVAVNHPPKNR